MALTRPEWPGGYESAVLWALATIRAGEIPNASDLSSMFKLSMSGAEKAAEEADQLWNAEQPKPNRPAVNPDRFLNCRNRKKK